MIYIKSAGEDIVMMKRWGWGLLLLVAGLALWLLFGSGRVFGHDIGGFGMTLLIGVAWAALYGVSNIPQGEFERGVSPGEWKAWIGFGFMLVATAFFFVRVYAQGGDVYPHPHAPIMAGVARDLVLLLVAWIVLTQVVSARWKGRVLQDERDREIEAKAADWGRGALVFVIIGLAVTFGFTPADRLQWVTHAMVANLLVFALMWGWLVEYAATVAMYVHDRRH